MYCRLAAIAIVVLTGCKTKQQLPMAPQRTAVLRFENMGSAAADWQGRALSEILNRRFEAGRAPRSESSVPGISAERLPAVNAGVSRLISGYYTSDNGKLQVTAFAEDSATQKQLGPVHATGSLGEVTEAIARKFGARLQSDSFNSDSPAVREYAVASDIEGPGAVPHYELAIAADPDFGPAYLGLLQKAVRQRDGAQVQKVLAAASMHEAKFNKQDRAYFQLESATLMRDAHAQVEALTVINSLGAPDAETLQALGDSEMAVRRPADAVKHYRQAIAAAPADANLRNLLTYASLYAGDEAGARTAAGEYRRLRPQDPNAFDTAGDVEFAYGHFAEAEKIYLSTPDAAFQNYLPGWKAARARLTAGDLTGANQLFEQHRTQLQKAKNPIAGYRAPEWQWLTGHRPEAARALAAFAETAKQPELRSSAYAQAAIWAVLVNNMANAGDWATLAMRSQIPGTFGPAAAARFLSQPAASAAEWQRRANTAFSRPNTIQARRLTLGLALFRSKYYAEALPVWKQVYESTSVTEVAPAYLYGVSLRETGHAAEAAPLLRLYPIPASGIAPSFEAFYLPFATMN